MQGKVREIGRGGGGDGVETEAYNFIGNSSSDGQPVEMSEYWCGVNMWRCTDYKTDCTIFDSLKFADYGLRETIQERISIVNALKYKGNQKNFGRIINKVVANCADTSDFQESSFADGNIVHQAQKNRDPISVPNLTETIRVKEKADNLLKCRKRCVQQMILAKRPLCFLLVFSSLQVCRIG